MRLRQHKRHARHDVVRNKRDHKALKCHSRNLIVANDQRKQTNGQRRIDARQLSKHATVKFDNDARDT